MVREKGQLNRQLHYDACCQNTMEGPTPRLSGGDGKSIAKSYTEFLTIPHKEQRYPESILLQYKDGLTDSETEEECKKVTEALLEALQALGHQVSAKKTQLFGALHHLLGYNLEDGKRTLAQG
ncbi:putative Pol polyprotein [Cricetulus griseus]|nr:putative Pol polyprotein [Cricetulus griseus]